MTINNMVFLIPVNELGGQKKHQGDLWQSPFVRRVVEISGQDIIDHHRKSATIVLIFWENRYFLAVVSLNSIYIINEPISVYGRMGILYVYGRSWMYTGIYQIEFIIIRLLVISSTPARCHLWSQKALFKCEGKVIWQYPLDDVFFQIYMYREHDLHSGLAFRTTYHLMQNQAMMVDVRQ